MAKLHEKNKTIIPSAERTFNSSNRDTIALSSKRVANDIYKISDFINQVIVKSYDSLTSSREYPYDVLEWGISGDTLITWTKELGNARGNHPIFWKTENEIDVGRPCTVRESFDWIYRNFSRQIQQIERTSVDFSPLEEAIRCQSFKIEKLKNEILTKDYTLDCDGVVNRRYKYSLSTHVYNIIAQLTEGMDASVINPYNDPDPNYPPLSIPYNRISDRIEYAHQLKDVDYDGSGGTKAGNGQILVWDTSVRDSDLEVDEPSEGTWVAKYPNEVFSDTDTNIHHIDELKDVDTSGTLIDDQVLVWDSSHEDSSSNGETGAWIPKDLNLLIPELPDLTSNIGQRVGTKNNDSTLSDVYSLSEIRNAWLAEHSLNDQSEATLEQSLDLTRRSASRFRAGANLIYDGDIWHSKLSGNTSNLNEVEFVPEVYLKQSDHISGLSSSEKEQLIHGGYNAVPFVFINNFDVKMKELLEPNFKALIAYSTGGEIPLTGNETLDNLSEGFDESSIGSILNSSPSKSGSLLENEISTNSPSRPIGSMKVSEKYTDSEGVERVYYKPEKLLGVCRTDMGTYEIPLPGVPLQRNFIEDSEGNLTGEINPILPIIVQAKVAKNIGIEVQHSGYSRIMVLGPYVHGDNLYICPAPILEIAGINYPYGICISDTFVSTPLKELFLGEKDVLLSSSYPNLYSQANFSIYDMIADALTVIDSELKNKILSCPVAFITRDDSPFATLDISLNNSLEDVANHNIANGICRNLLGLNSSSSSTGSAIVVGILNYFDNISSEERFNYQSDVLHATGGSLATKYIYNAGSLHLPLCKIATGSFNHEGVKETVNDFDWVNFINPSIIGGYLNIAGLDLGLVVGQDGSNGTNGSDGGHGMITISGNPIEHPEKSDGTTEVIPSNYNLVPSGHNLTYLTFSKQSYPTLNNFDFSLQLRIADLTQTVKVSVLVALRPDSWQIGDDPVLYNPVNIKSENTTTSTLLSLDPSAFENDNVVTISNEQGKWDMNGLYSVSVIVDIRTTEENLFGLNDICSGIYTSLIIDPN